MWKHILFSPSFLPSPAPQFNPPRVGPDSALLSWISPQSATLHPAKAPVSSKGVFSWFMELEHSPSLKPAASLYLKTVHLPMVQAMVLKNKSGRRPINAPRSGNGRRRGRVGLYHLSWKPLITICISILICISN
ncbi:hypothetical protein [Methanobacterium aggregans]|uniref:hypothetical protein n=1 Tax=Methanobacterium aggregans TaxID=1615586 RepID=UPI001AE4B8D1|nr:hypothetical protein [Methanobacterium aggregans]MBP2045159.1 hypothetical protein [Methanobacterium aggregans]